MFAVFKLEFVKVILGSFSIRMRNTNLLVSSTELVSHRTYLMLLDHLADRAVQATA
jgi:hypothetical protein